MKDLRCLVVDDEPLAADVVVNFLQRLDVNAITRCENGIDAFRCLQEHTFDLLFLDIEMPQLSGFDLLKSLQNRPLVVITTAYRDHAVEGFEWEVLDYLVKPFSLPRFMKTMEKAFRVLQQPEKGAGRAGHSVPAAETAAGTDAEAAGVDGEERGFIFLKTDRQWTRVEISAILYVESLKDYIRVVLCSGEYICHQPLTDITATLPSGKFIRVHRSYTVALDKIDQVKHHCAYVRGKTIPISRANRAEVYRRLGQ